MGSCRQTFEFYKFIDRAKSKKIYNLTKYELGIIMRYTTGHAHLRRHDKIAGTMKPFAFGPEQKYTLDDPEHVAEEDDPEIRCRLCNLKGKQETPYHLLKECLRIWRLRYEMFGIYTLENEEIIHWSPARLVDFYKKLDLENRPNQL